MQHILNKLKNMENVPKVDLKNGILSSLDNRQIRDHSIKKKKISTRSPALTQRSASEPKSTSNMSGNFVHNFPKHQQSTATVSGCYSYLQVHMPTQPNSSNEFLRLSRQEPFALNTSDLMLTSTCPLPSAFNEKIAPTRSHSQPVSLLMPVSINQSSYHEEQIQYQPQYSSYSLSSAAFRRDEFKNRLNSFNKRSDSESDDLWSCVVPIESEQQHVQQTTIASTTNATATITSNTTLLTNMITTTTITTTTSFVRQLASCDCSSSSEQHRYPMCVSNFEPQRHSHQQINKIFHDSSRQISDDISWEFAISEAPIARLESLDELDQDHGK
ncbi:uncharacterized protein LOC107982113 isoform X1 [Nasonia vitripennis]|uniref:Uncharacterized protein n=1 Tax=Nasonia vitripennis TaxID=7425 RepID=A0A7M7QK24_NASVI|nr:uncharacterized protein LOC107982113 isoform X1 [Nasonia vitripennis]XP_031788977.1 uncharacterized protein LOC107982113 isoform X1 [Nasonia vitripennis]